MKVFDPVAAVAKPPEARPRRILETLRGKRLGFIWDQHVSSVEFWPSVEKVIERMYQPSAVYRLYKQSTWNAATPAELEELGRKVDYVIVGVGA
jgi:hypothetical protein